MVKLLCEIEEIPANTFENCTKLTEVVLADSITAIGQSAFSGCTSLVNVPKFSELRKISRFAFSGCRNLRDFVLGSENTSVPAFAYRSCDSIESVTIPARIERIEDGAFAECGALSSVVFEAGNLSYIGSNVFYQCNKLTSISLPESLRIIADYAFYECRRLADISIPKNTAYIGENAFYETPWLKDNKDDFIVAGDGILVQYNGMASDIVFPDTVKRIHDFKFFNKYLIKSVTLPESVEIISTKAFVYKVTGKDSSGNETTAYRFRYLTVKGIAGSFAEQFSKREYYTWSPMKAK